MPLSSFRWNALLLAVVLAMSDLACNPSLPEPDSPGAKLYAERCADPCHRLYAPRVLKFEMWKVQVQRMQGELARGGLAPLTPEEVRVMLDYLRRHSG